MCTPPTIKEYCNSILHLVQHQELVFINDITTRKMLKRWIEEPLDDPSLQFLKDLLRDKRPELTPAVTDVQCPEEYRWFIDQLIKTSPSAFLVPQESHGAVTDFLEGEISADQAKILSCSAPAVFRLYSEGSHSVQWVRCCVQALLSIAKQFAATTPHSISSPLNSVGFFPHLPPVSGRGSYFIDRKPADDTQCTKNAGNHGKLLPGVFTQHCKHGEY